MRYTVGLTGGIGSGKSTVADRFAAHGIVVVDADVEAHRLTGPDGAAIAGDPRRVRRRASSTRAAHSTAPRCGRTSSPMPDARRRLESILHPMIRAACDRARDAATSPYVLLVVPLLFEAGDRAAAVHRTLVIACDEAIQVARVMKRSGLSASEVRAIIATQMPAAERIARADDVDRQQWRPVGARRAGRAVARALSRRGGAVRERLSADDTTLGPRLRGDDEPARGREIDDTGSPPSRGRRARAREGDRRHWVPAFAGTKSPRAGSSFVNRGRLLQNRDAAAEPVPMRLPALAHCDH